MNLDKDDLFRNALPGLVFVLVVLSFFVMRDGWKIITEMPNVLTLFLCFPLGFIIQSVHRILHIRLEQERMQQEDMNSLEPGVRTRLENTFRDINERAQWLAFSLNSDENKPFKERINFLNTHFQTLGACCIAVIAALPFRVLIKARENVFSFWTELWQMLENSSFWLPALLWFILAIFLWVGRERVREDYQSSRRAFNRLARIGDDGLLVPGGLRE